MRDCAHPFPRPPPSRLQGLPLMLLLELSLLHTWLLVQVRAPLGFSSKLAFRCLPRKGVLGTD